MSNDVDWDDWKVVHELANAGTASGAAERLGMNVTTVTRRIDRIEERLGVQLFERGREGARATLQTEAILEDLQSLRRTTEGIETLLVGMDEAPSGEVTLSLNLHVYSYLIPEVPRLLHQAYPQIRVILDVTDRVVSLKNREADIVVRGSNDPDPDLYGRKVQRLSYALYGDQSWADRVLSGADPIDFPDLTESIDWIGYTGALDITAPAHWQRKHVQEDRIIISATEVGAMVGIAASGLACGVMPCFVADRHPGLVRLTRPIPGLHTELWVLTLRELRKTARVAALFDLMVRTLADRTAD